MNDQEAELFLVDLRYRIDTASSLDQRIAPITWDRAAALLSRSPLYALDGPGLKRIITHDLARLNIREATIESETGPDTYGLEMSQIRLAIRRVSHDEPPLQIQFT